MGRAEGVSMKIDRRPREEDIMRGLNTKRADEADPSASSWRYLATLASLLVPGVGQLMLGRRLRGGIWLAGFLALALTGTVHLLPGLVLMVVAALDTWWMGAPERKDPEPKIGTR